MFAYFNLSASFLQGIDTFLKQVNFCGESSIKTAQNIRFLLFPFIFFHFRESASVLPTITKGLEGSASNIARLALFLFAGVAANFHLQPARFPVFIIANQTWHMFSAYSFYCRCWHLCIGWVGLEWGIELALCMAAWVWILPLALSSAIGVCVA